jgi:uncharacterized protein
MMGAELPKTVLLELGLDDADDAAALCLGVSRQLGVDPSDLPELALRKRSLDCRRGRVRFHYLLELVEIDDSPLGLPHPVEVKLLPKMKAPVTIVGDGPAGMFCAYQLARSGVACIVLERGKEVQPRRKDLKGLTRRGVVDPDSNYCFGEGGAGTYSDGKLYTRAHKRGPVRDVLEILSLHGAPRAILVEARPHIGSNRLPQVVSALRERLMAVGVQFRFGARVTRLLHQGGRVSGVELSDGERIASERVVLATGHSARDVHQLLVQAGVQLEPKPFALGVRIEHPQSLIDTIQYGKHAGHPRLPAAAYTLRHCSDPTRATQRAQGAPRGVFSFCMCPGGFIVPASTSAGELVVNGMSLSRRDSRYANSGIVVEIPLEDLRRAGFDGPLAGVDLQRTIETLAFEAGGPQLQAPATRMSDFIARRASNTVPACSYVPGLTATDVAAVLDGAGLQLSDHLRQGLLAFGRRLPGYLSEEAVLVGVESRTSSAIRIPRTAGLQNPILSGLYPSGEGAGYAGGIVSAALDGMRVARAIELELGVGPVAGG